MKIEDFEDLLKKNLDTKVSFHYVNTSEDNKSKTDCLYSMENVISQQGNAIIKTSTLKDHLPFASDLLDKVKALHEKDVFVEIKIDGEEYWLDCYSIVPITGDISEIFLNP